MLPVKEDKRWGRLPAYHFSAFTVMYREMSLKKGSSSMEYKINFIISGIPEEEMEALKEGLTIITKMILTPDDFELFHYNKGGRIQVETGHGNRLWCIIDELEVVESNDRVILIFTLTHEG
jgi:hypothetical protein